MGYETSAYMGRTSLFDVLEYPDTVDILFLGDSHTERADFCTLFKGKTVVHQGIGGDTSKGLLNRLSYSDRIKANVIFLEIGINDLMQGVSVDVLLQNYENVLDSLIQSHPLSKICVETIYPIDKNFEDNALFYVTRENIRESNTRIIKIAQKKGCEVVDAYKMLSDDEGYLKNVYTCDGLHLTGSGYLKLKTEMDNFLN